MKQFTIKKLVALTVLVCQMLPALAAEPDLADPKPIAFPAPWTSPYTVNPKHPHHLVNAEGRHLFILGKTAWAYFGCKNPDDVLRRAKSQGVTVLRVQLEGRPYWKDLGIELWPWAGSRDEPDWSRFNQPYWEEVERRVKLAGEQGIGLDIVLYTELHPDADQVPRHQPYWQETLRRLGRYSNVLTWEIANEYVRNEEFQDAAGEFLAKNDPFKRPICTSDGTTDDAVWPHKPWLALAINHSCTSSTDAHGLRDWYLAVARNTRSHGKPAWCNESGREKRHRNDDAVHRRKQGWLWYAAGCYWTHHSWDGCEGIDDTDYRAPGEQFLKPMSDFWQSMNFWELAPNHTTIAVNPPSLVTTALADPRRRVVVAYTCTERTGQEVSGASASLSLPPGEYRARFVRPADNKVLGTVAVTSQGTHRPNDLPLPAFTDDLAIVLTK